MGTVNAAAKPLAPKGRTGKRRFRNQLALQSMIVPGLLIFLIFEYGPMFGLTIAFREYSFITGFWDAPWVGFRHFERFFRDPNFIPVMRNTLMINVLGLLIAFPAPLIFALLLNEMKQGFFKRFTQTVSYLPHFVAWVVFGGLVITLLSPSHGAVNSFLLGIGVIERPIFFMGTPQYFWVIAVFTQTLKGFGFGAILYLAAMSGVDPQLHEAAIVDGAGRFRRVWSITLPSIMGTTVILMIFTIANFMNTGFEQIWTLQNNLNISHSETIDTYIYRVGLQQLRFSYSTAVSFFRSGLAVILVLSANWASKKITEHGLF